MSDSRKIRLCSLGLGGSHLEYGGGCSSSWYLGSPEEVVKHYAHELEPGVLLIDKRPALDQNCAYAFASPMVDVDMADGEVDRFASRYLASGGGIMVDAIKESGSQWGTIIKAAEIAKVAPDVPGLLDFVPVAYYSKWWHDRGALIYKYDGSQFVPC